jgi:hypothetical protein
VANVAHTGVTQLWEYVTLFPFLEDYILRHRHAIEKLRVSTMK